MVIYSGSSHDQKQYSGRLWCLNDAQLVLLKCAKKIFPTTPQPELLKHGGMDPCIRKNPALFSLERFLNHYKYLMENN